MPQAPEIPARALTIVFVAVSIISSPLSKIDVTQACDPSGVMTTLAGKEPAGKVSDEPAFKLRLMNGFRNGLLRKLVLPSMTVHEPAGGRDLAASKGKAPEGSRGIWRPQDPS